MAAKVTDERLFERHGYWQRRYAGKRVQRSCSPSRKQQLLAHHRILTTRRSSLLPTYPYWHARQSRALMKSPTHWLGAAKNQANTQT